METGDPKTQHLTYQERKALGICRDCEEVVSEESTIMCKVHAGRVRGYRKKKKAEAKQAKAD